MSWAEVAAAYLKDSGVGFPMQQSKLTSLQLGQVVKPLEVH